MEINKFKLFGLESKKFEVYQAKPPIIIPKKHITTIVVVSVILL